MAETIILTGTVYISNKVKLMFRRRDIQMHISNPVLRRSPHSNSQRRHERELSSVSESLAHSERLKTKLERSVQSHMEREQKLLSTHEADMAQAAQLNERLRNQLAERDVETTNHKEEFKKKVCGSNKQIFAPFFTDFAQL